MAFSKMLGFDVAPTTASSSMSCCRWPPRVEERERKSIHTLCPIEDSSSSGEGFSEDMVDSLSARNRRGALQQRRGLQCDVLGREAKFFQHGRTRGGGAEAVEAEHR